MAYQALYRKWRPQKFEDMVGQTAVTKTLKNAIIHHKTSHAYLFTGPRGTGKTSAAKIFAKAINCLNPQDGEPCNDCLLCKGITEGTIGDVIEIDAASNNGVEEIRDIRDKARYAPTQATYKVYIIDEVHMLSTGAFNALLKTLEEPPKNVIFILATTEPHKIPATIISRTQRFDFRRITNDEIIQRLRYILEQEEIAYEEEALSVIARCANGGMRDALSLLDQVISFSDDKVSFEQAIQVSGSLTDDLMIEFVRLLTQQQAQAALLQLQDLLLLGKEASRLIEEWLEFSRDLLVAKQTGDMIGRSEVFVEFAKEVEEAFLYRFMDALNQTQQEMRFTTKPTISLEVFTIKMAQPVVAVDQQAASTNQEYVSQLEQQLQSLQQQMSQLLQGQGVVAPKKATSTLQAKASTYKPNIGEVYKVLDAATRKDLIFIRELWGDLLQMLSTTQRALLKASEPVAASPNGFVLKFDYEILCQRAQESVELHEDIARHCQTLAQYPGNFVSVTGEQWVQIRQDYLRDKKEKQESEGVTHATEMEEQPTDEEEKNEVEQLVQNTIDLFGEEIVHISEETENN
ncbi:DNA polymerase III subunit gamma/tau [Granulicatella elegans]|uniref:DNA-directed DNA polymerase n=1 Tax=Granulicatella elegans ATCC 700633 TaxID=626369 RepID=D0BM74_9LACT|nr:DNA polymerase III subunit gamma/tau [Granulicatella elegans]EEW93089.1 DNA polymerase III, subunit gamma and tau [Granulicatella elegans ATCC 700633]